mgnify:CR=1 FL=1
MSIFNKIKALLNKDVSEVAAAIKAAKAQKAEFQKATAKANVLQAKTEAEAQEQKRQRDALRRAEKELNESVKELNKAKKDIKKWRQKAVQWNTEAQESFESLSQTLDALENYDLEMGEESFELPEIGSG